MNEKEKLSSCFFQLSRISVEIVEFSYLLFYGFVFHFNLFKLKRNSMIVGGSMFILMLIVIVVDWLLVLGIYFQFFSETNPIVNFILALLVGLGLSALTYFYYKKTVQPKA